MVEYLVYVWVKTNNRFMKKNKQFIVKLCHKYIHNINEDILQIYIILQYTYPFRRESFQQTVLLRKKKKLKQMLWFSKIHKEHLLTLDSVTHPQVRTDMNARDEEIMDLCSPQMRWKKPDLYLAGAECQAAHYSLWLTRCGRFISRLTWLWAAMEAQEAAGYLWHTVAQHSVHARLSGRDLPQGSPPLHRKHVHLKVI